jgi:hypothetical protein
MDFGGCGSCGSGSLGEDIALRCGGGTGSCGSGSLGEDIALRCGGGTGSWGSGSLGEDIAAPFAIPFNSACGLVGAPHICPNEITPKTVRPINARIRLTLVSIAVYSFTWMELAE